MKNMSKVMTLVACGAVVAPLLAQMTVPPPPGTPSVTQATSALTTSSVSKLDQEVTKCVNLFGAGDINGMNAIITKMPSDFRSKDVNTLFLMGSCYYLGWGAQIDDEKSYALLGAAAAAGSLRARALKAVMVSGGLVKDVDPESSEGELAAVKPQLLDRANKGSLFEQWLLACVECGMGNENEAEKWFCKAAESGFAPARETILIDDLYSGDKQKVDKALAELRALADKGCTGSDEHVLFALLVNGHNEEAAALAKRAFPKALKMASERKSVSAAFLVGVCAIRGYGCVRNEKNGVAWLAYAANNDNRWAQLTLSECYRRGIGVDQNLQEAESWRKKAEMKKETARSEGCCTQVPAAPSVQPKQVQQRPKTKGSRTQLLVQYSRTGQTRQWMQLAEEIERDGTSDETYALATTLGSVAQFDRGLAMAQLAYARWQTEENLPVKPVARFPDASTHLKLIEMMKCAVTQSQQAAEQGRQGVGTGGNGCCKVCGGSGLCLVCNGTGASGMHRSMTKVRARVFLRTGYLKPRSFAEAAVGTRCKTCRGTGRCKWCSSSHVKQF